MDDDRYFSLLKAGQRCLYEAHYGVFVILQRVRGGIVERSSQMCLKIAVEPVDGGRKNRIGRRVYARRPGALAGPK